jgi:RNA polymerase sigma-70 factor (ECF subfamily)
VLDVHELEPLLQRVLARDGEAFNELLARLRGYVYHKVRAQLGAGPNGQIDQSAIAQSVLRRAWVRFPDLEDPTVPKLLGWIATIVRNRVTDELRQVARRRASPLGSDVVTLADPRPGAGSPERGETAAALAAALARLPERERRVVESHWIDHKSDKDTAEELHINTNHVRQLRFRALEKLRKLLGPSVEANR